MYLCLTVWLTCFLGINPDSIGVIERWRESAGVGAPGASLSFSYGLHIADDCVSKQHRLQRAYFQSPFFAAVTDARGGPYPR